MDDYELARNTVAVLERSPWLRGWNAAEYYRRYIFPQQQMGQTILFTADAPCGLVAWAWLSDRVMDAVVTEGRDPRIEEMQSGDHLFCTEWITLDGSTKFALETMTAMFPNTPVTGMKFNDDGTVRAIRRHRGRTS